MEKVLSISIILKGRWTFFSLGSLCFMAYQTIQVSTTLKPHHWLQVSRPLKSLLFWLKYWDTPFSLTKKMHRLRIQRSPKRKSSFSLTECLLCSPRWGLANMNRQVYTFIPSCYPTWLLGLSPNEVLGKTSRDERDGGWTHLHRAYQGFNIVIDNAPVPVAYILKPLCGCEWIYLMDTYGIFSPC